MKKNILFFLIGLWLLSACEKDTSEIVFDVSADRVTIKAGESVNFKLTGNPDNITFFSGEMGKRYDFVGRSSATGIPKLKFDAKLENAATPQGLSVLVSNKFEGLVFTLDSLNMRQIDTESSNKNISKPDIWSDISSQATWPATQNATKTSELDLSSFAIANKPVFIAFKWSGDAGVNQSKWTINNLSIVNYLPDGTSYTIGNLTTNSITNYGYSGATFSPGWKDFKASGDISWIVGTSSLAVTGKTAASSVSSESWVISGAIDLTKVTPDWGTAIKGMSATVATTTYAYKVAGTYTATFVAYERGIQIAMKQIQVVVQ